MDYLSILEGTTEYFPVGPWGGSVEVTPLACNLCGTYDMHGTDRSGLCSVLWVRFVLRRGPAP